ncbi:MAG TPA: hypothetical protein VES42_22570 [Pilimelia sp.]|nr:hypothetical protein [Pilimelia sp.]
MLRLTTRPGKRREARARDRLDHGWVTLPTARRRRAVNLDVPPMTTDRLVRRR